MTRRPRVTSTRGSIKRQKGRTNYNVRSTQRWIDNDRQGVGGVVAAEAGEITAAQIYAMEYVIKRELKGMGSKIVATPVQEIEGGEDKIKEGNMTQKRAGKYILRVYPHRPRSKKPNETGLGRGKGAIDRWVTRVRKGQIMIEYQCEDRDKAKRIEGWIGSKLPIKTQFIYR